jgi:hypothetical protein
MASNVSIPLTEASAEIYLATGFCGAMAGATPMVKRI